MFDDILVVLEDGRWHQLSEIVNRTRTPEETVLHIVRFLSEYGFANIDDKGERVKLDSDFLALP